MSAATRAPAETCHTDSYGLLDIRCLRAILAAEERAYTRGHAAGRQEVLDGIDASVAQVIRGAVKGIDVAAARRRPYTVPRWAS